MRFRLPLLVAAVGLVAVPAALAKPGTPTQPAPTGKLTINDGPILVSFGASIIINGEITGTNQANQEVNLFVDGFPYGDGFGKIARDNTGSEGAYRFVRVVTRNANFRVRTDIGNLHAEVPVRVYSRVGMGQSTTSTRRGRLVRFSGTVLPAHPGRFVRLQRRNAAGTFTTVRSVRLVPATTGRSYYTTLIRAYSTGYYRVVLYYDGDHLTSYSPTRRLFVAR